MVESSSVHTRSSFRTPAGGAQRRLGAAAPRASWRGGELRSSGGEAPKTKTTRVEGWEIRLESLLKNVAQRPFSRGTHDCATFAADGVQALTGRDVSAPFRGLYADRQEARQLLHEWGADLAGMATQECERLGFEYVGTLRVRKFLGAADQAADPDLAAEAPSWMANHRLRGCAYLYLRLTYDQDTYPSGIPNISADVTGKSLYDPRTGVTTWSASPALALYDYFTDVRHGMGLASTAVDTTYLNAVANLCDEMVDTRSVDTQVESVSAVENSLSLVGDLCRLQTGDRVTITEDDLRGPITMRTRHSRRERYNAVKGVYVSPLNYGQPADYPPVTGSIFETKDGSERRYLDLDLPFASRPQTAQRLAKVELYRHRREVAAE